MKCYPFKIPTPSAKRLETNRKFVVEICGSCWSGFTPPKEYDIRPGATHLLWEGPDELEVHEPELLDADYGHRFYIEFSNSTGTRKEKVPVEVLQGVVLADYQLLPNE